MKQLYREQVERLQDRVRSIAAQPGNRDRLRFWQDQPETARDHWRGTPRARAQLPRAPITVEPDLPMWGRILGFDVQDFYTQPEVYLVNQMKMAMYRHEQWSEETCVSTEIPIWLGATFESSLFGARTIYARDQSPWLDREPVLRTPADLDALEYPDFRESGLMPLAHQYYEAICELVDDDFTVLFPEMGRSPFGIAYHLCEQFDGPGPCSSDAGLALLHGTDDLLEGLGHLLMWMEVLQPDEDDIHP